MPGFKLIKFLSLQMNFSRQFSDVLHLATGEFSPHNEVWAALAGYCQLLPGPRVWHPHSCAQALLCEAPPSYVCLLIAGWCHPNRLIWCPYNSASTAHTILLQHIWKEGKFSFVKTITYSELEENNLFGQNLCFSIKDTCFPFAMRHGPAETSHGLLSKVIPVGTILPPFVSMN